MWVFVNIHVFRAITGFSGISARATHYVVLKHNMFKDYIVLIYYISSRVRDRFDSFVL